MVLDTRVLKSGKCEISNGWYSGHQAVDLVGGGYTLDYVVAHSAGTVVAVEKNCNENTSGDPRYNSTRVANIYGNYVKIRHDNGMYTLYAHLKYGSVTVDVGDRVDSQSVIGYMGNTGYSFGAHLHFEVRNTSDKKVNPTEYIGKELPNESTSYSTGNYVCLYDMKVRDGAGLEYRVKKVSELTQDGKNNATTTNIYAYAVYKKGTIFTAYSIVESNSSLWARTPSGYVCIKDAMTQYCDKI